MDSNRAPFSSAFGALVLACSDRLASASSKVCLRLAQVRSWTRARNFMSQGHADLAAATWLETPFDPEWLVPAPRHSAIALRFGPASEFRPFREGLAEHQLRAGVYGAKGFLFDPAPVELALAAIAARSEQAQILEASSPSNAAPRRQTL